MYSIAHSIPVQDIKPANSWLEVTVVLEWMNRGTLDLHFIYTTPHCPS
jgi:hypothetical protein